MDYFFTCLFVFIVSLVWFLYQKSPYKRRVDLINAIPGPKPWPIFGNVNELGYLNSVTKDFNILSIFFQHRTGLAMLFRENIYRLWVGSKPTVVVFGADTVEPLLKSNVLLDKGDFYRFLVPWLGDGLLLSKGDKWRRHRKQLTPTFHFRILDNFLTVMNEQSVILVEKIKEASRNREWIDILHLLSMCTLDVICETAMGYRLGAQHNHESDYVKAVQCYLEQTALRGPRPWLRHDFLYLMTAGGRMYRKALKTLHSFTESVIRERMSNKRKPDLESNDDDNFGKKKLAFLDLLLESEEGEFTFEELREQVDTFMFAGHDTTSTALSWVFYLLGLYPQVQEQLLGEVDRIFSDDKSRPVSQEDMRQLKYMDNVMKECQRLYPSVPGFGRKLTEDLKIKQYIVPKGVTLAVNTYLVHRDPAVYPDPEKFDPDRFSPENSTGRSPYAFIPFSAGARNCIGQRYALQEQKVILCHVFRNYRVVSLDQRDQILLKPAAVLRTDKPLRIFFIPRK